MTADAFSEPAASSGAGRGWESMSCRRGVGEMTGDPSLFRPGPVFCPIESYPIFLLSI